MKPAHHEKPICATCGGDNVLKDAWARWDVELQEWQLDNVFDDAFCEDCDSARKLKWVPITDNSEE